ncbi:hypothetical protein ABMA27_004383 [Loxostege sticticalis]
MCRAQIPSDYLDHPVLLEKVLQQEIPNENASEEVENQWYYEGRNGWWKYDERSNAELESAFNAGDADCALLLAGAVYTIDFQNMIQFRRNDPTRRRRVRRDTPTLPAKGVAGIKNIGIGQSEQPKLNNEDHHDEVVTISDPESEVIIVEDDDETTEDENLNQSLDIVHVISTLSLVDPDSPRTILGNESADDT